MDSTVSVSKGCFIFNAPAASTKKQKSSQKAGHLFFDKERWYIAYKSLWNSLENKLQRAYSDVYSNMLKDLVDYVELSQEPSTTQLAVPVATLLTGVNMPDHVALFAQLQEILHARVTPHVATLHACDCATLRSTVEQIVSQLVMGSGNPIESYQGEESSDEEEEVEKVLKKHQCTFSTLEAWYRELLDDNMPTAGEISDAASNGDSPKKSTKKTEYKSPTKDNILVENDENMSPTFKRIGLRHSPTKRSSSADASNDVKPAIRRKTSSGRPIIVIVIPEFEGFDAKVLQTLLSIVSSKYQNLPMTFVFGVATSVHALRYRLSFRISSKLSFNIFQLEKSINFLDLVLERVFLTPDCPFLLGGRTFKLFCEVFLFYDFSVEAFIQHFKFCLLEHFFGKDINSLCCSLDQLEERVAHLAQADIALIRKLPSFVAYGEKCEKSEKEMLTNGSNVAIKKEIQKMVLDLRHHSSNLFTMLQVLHVFCSNLPTAPLGKHIRKLYESSITEDICGSKEFKECFKMLGLQSRDELLVKLDNATAILTTANSGDKKPFKEPISRLRNFATLLGNAGMTVPKSAIKSPTKSSPKSISLADGTGKKISRSQFLLNMKAGCAKNDQPRSDYEITREDLINYLTVLLPKFLTPLTSLPLHELMLFDNVAIVKKHIIGSPRAAIHMALHNPQYYLQCECCVLPTRSAVQSSLPDLCIAYKLHLECGKLINLYDWLQAFASIVNADHDAEGQISPEIQARFASSVSELQLLGFIKTTKKKADHVSRLTHNPR